MLTKNVSIAVNSLQLEDQYYLTDLRLGDEDDLFQCFQTDDIIKNTLRIPFPYTMDNASYWINFCINQANETGILWYFSIRTNDGHVIGAVAINEVVDGVAEIGYWLSPKYWGRGIMVPCLLTFCNFIEKNSNIYQIHRLEANIFSTNYQSQRVLEKCGFHYDGEVPNKYIKDGVSIDAKLFWKSCCESVIQNDS